MRAHHMIEECIPLSLINRLSEHSHGLNAFDGTQSSTAASHQGPMPLTRLDKPRRIMAPSSGQGWFLALLFWFLTVGVRGSLQLSIHGCIDHRFNHNRSHFRSQFSVQTIKNSPSSLYSQIPYSPIVRELLYTATHPSDCSLYMIRSQSFRAFTFQ